MISFEEFDRKINLVLDQQRQIMAELAQIKAEKKFGAGRLTYTLKEAEEITGLKYNTLHARCKSGQLPCIQDQAKGSIRITKETLELLINENIGLSNPIDIKMIVQR